MNNEIGYNATANVDDYYEDQTLGGLAPGQITDPTQIVQPEPTEEEEEEQQQPSQEREPINDQINPETGEAYDNNFFQEVGTAIMGAGIDLVEEYNVEGWRFR